MTRSGDDQTCHEVIPQAVSPYGAAFVNDLDPSALAGAKDTVSGLELLPTASAVLVVKRGPNTGFPICGWISRSHPQAAIPAVTSSSTT